jgi:uncharacterized Zn finger protein
MACCVADRAGQRTSGGFNAVACRRIATVSALARLLSEPHLRRLAGERSFERGADYLASGRVTRLARGDEHIDASVKGTQRYRIELWVADGELAASFTCPMGQDGAFCKHCVAVGLAPPGSTSWRSERGEARQLAG